MATTVYSNWSQYNKTYTDRRYRAFLIYTVSTTNTTVTVTAYSGVQVNKSIAATWTGTQTMDGSTKSGSKHLSYTKGATDEKLTIISTQTYTYTRTTSNVSHSLSSSTKSTESGFRGDTVTASASITVPALQRYSVTYNANGGTGTPATQYKYYGQTLVLTGKPTRTGYTFRGWGTSATTTTVSYNVGANYTANANVTLYAIWQINTWQVSYKANGGSGSIATQTKIYGTNLTLSNGAGFTKSFYEIEKWNTAADGSGMDYALGDVYTANEALSLYAIWKLAYIMPEMTNFRCYRVASGTIPSGRDPEETDDGRYIYIAFDYVGGSTDGGETHITPTLEITIGGVSIESPGTLSGGSYASAFGSYSEDLSFTVTVHLYDDKYQTGITQTAQIDTATYAMDLLAEGLDVFVGINHKAVSGQKLTVPELFNIGMIGSVQLYAGSSAPNGWLFCDGSAVSRTVYEELFDVIGTTYGTGDGSTTFNLPDLKGRVPIGAGTGSASTSTNHALGSSGGQETHTLTPAQTALKSHTHKVTLGSHRHYPYSGSSYKFVQTTSGQTVNAGGISGSGTRVYVAAATSATTNWQSQTGSTDLGEKTTGGVTEANGSAHNNMQPYLTMNYIIFTGKPTM